MTTILYMFWNGFGAGAGGATLIGSWFAPIECHGNADRIETHGNADRIET